MPNSFAALNINLDYLVIEVSPFDLIFGYLSKNITVATGAGSPAVGALKDVPTSFGDLNTNLYYLVIEFSPFDVIFGYLAIENLQAVIDLWRRQGTLD